MKNIRSSIAKASDTREPLSVRHEAFGELVKRFQDMAFGCAYAVLGDSYLAEDVAQEAFVAAWQKLDQVREVDAFPGWFKRIVLSQCNRLTRGKRLQIVPLEVGEVSAASGLDPHAVAEQRQIISRVLSAISGLPENERMVTTLFYVDGYTQSDIGHFLEVPVSTVNKRLYTARQRLKGSVDVVKENLHNRRPSRDRNFSDRVNANLRPMAERDWSLFSSMASARERLDGPGNELWLNRRQNFDDTQYIGRQYVAEDANTKQILAFGAIEQTKYLPRYRLFLVADPRWLRSSVGDLLLERLMTDLREANAVTVSCREYSSQVELLMFLKDRSFREIDRVLDLRLEVGGAELSPLSAIIEKLKGEGITITTFAEERIRDPRCVEKLHELGTILHEDDPWATPYAPPAYNQREALMWLEMPYMLPGAYFIAKQGDAYLGFSEVSLFEAVPGGLTQGFTGVRREYRRRNIATAMKLHQIEYAFSHGYKIIQSFNRPTQSAILALNQKLGFQVLTSSVTMERCLKEVVEVNPKIYDDYAGRYRDDECLRDVIMTVRNEGGRLTGEAIGQKVELFPTSETQFFVKQFYGEATFIRDDDGRVDLMKFAMPAYKNRKASIQHAKRIE